MLLFCEVLTGLRSLGILGVVQLLFFLLAAGVMVYAGIGVYKTNRHIAALRRPVPPPPFKGIILGPGESVEIEFHEHPPHLVPRLRPVPRNGEHDA
jgi:hypothetical protein